MSDPDQMRVGLVSLVELLLVGEVREIVGLVLSYLTIKILSVPQVEDPFLGLTWK